MEKGKIKWFDYRKGYGFIERENDEDDLFVHRSAFDGYILDGDTVEYEIGEGNKGPCAVNVKKVEE